MPYLQLDLEAKKMVPRVARALGVPDCQIGWGLIELWDWCWTEKRAVVSPLLLHGFFGATNGNTGLVLGEFGFLEKLPDDGGYRVRGAEKYLRVSEARSRAGKARMAGAKRDQKGCLSTVPAGPAQSSTCWTGAGELTSSQPALTPNHPSTQSPNTYTKEALDSVESAPPKPKRAVREKEADPRHAPLRRRLVDEFEKARGHKYGFTGRDAKAISSLLGKEADEEIVLRWRRGLGATAGYRRLDDIHGLDAKWNSLGKDPPGAGSGDVRKGYARADQQDWSGDGGYGELNTAGTG